MLKHVTIPYVKLSMATLASLPLFFILLLPSGTLSGLVPAESIIMAMPFLLELLGFYTIYKFTSSRQNFSKQEQKLLPVLAAGIFVLIGAPMLVLQAIEPTTGVSFVALAITMTYALASLLLNAARISRSGKHISA